MVNVSVVTDAPRVGRKLRSPKHTFSLRQMPYQIQPFFIAPVLPGETMKNMLVQATCKSPPLRSPNVGWWYEQYYFYVKHRDLDARELLTEMHLTGQSIASLNTPVNAKTYNGRIGVDWVQLCLDRVVDEYFRDEGEAVMDFQFDGLPMAQIANDTWIDSAKLSSQVVVPDDETLPGEVDPHVIPAGFELHHAQWEQMRGLGMTAATFEDYLKTFGVKPAAAEKELKHKPELIRYLKDWQVPKVSPSDGAGYCVWNVSERADKDRYFSEPGFVFGVTVARCKLYLGNQISAGVSMMDNAYAWLPAVMQSEPYTSLVKYAADLGPLKDQAEEYWVDLRDLLMHGDQFANFDTSDISPAVDNGVDPYLSATAAWQAGMVALPTVNLDRKYLDASQAGGLVQNLAPFVTDGVVSLSILSTITDTSL